MPERRLYQIGTFATRAGTTVRALRHYDRIGLLLPTARSSGRNRLYADEDLVRLQQIVTLKFIGLSLGQIRQVLKQRRKVKELLALQRKALEERKRRLDRIIEAIRAAEHAGEGSVDRFRTIVEVIAMEQKKDVLQDWYGKYYTPEQIERFKQRSWSPKDQKHAEAKWKAIFEEAKKLFGSDPGAPAAQKVAARWYEMISQFTQGDPEIEKSLDAMYKDIERWPKEAYQHVRPENYDPKVFEFIAKAVAIYRKKP